MTRLDGQTALITGAAGGMGRAVAAVLVECGASVALNDVNEEGVERALDELGDAGSGTMGVAGDITDAATVRRIVERVTEKWGRLDILVTAAGLCPSGRFEETSESEWDRVFAVNMKAMFLCCREAIPVMLEQGGGSIVNFASNAGKTAEPFIVPYAASKFGVVGLTQGLAREYASRRIRVNCVCPAMAETDMMERLAVDYAGLHGGTIEQWKQSFHEEIPWGRMARPDDVANVIRFLVDPASEFMTGQAINVAGGLEMH